MQSIDEYSDQIESGFRFLSFKGKLESAYVDHIRDQQRISTLICGYFVLLIWLGFAFLDSHRISSLQLWGKTDLLIYLWIGVRLAVLLLIAGTIIIITFDKNLKYENYSIVCYISIGLGAAITADIEKYYGAFSADSAQVIVVMAAFLPLGFRFYAALRAALLVAIIDVLLISFGGDRRAPDDRLQLSAMLILAVPVAAVGGYLREYADRGQYLLTGFLNREAMTDALTALLNRRGLAFYATNMIRQAKRAKTNITVAIADIDYFKQFNDNSGHPEGDLVLQKVARALAQSVRRPLDMVARIGGEEFCILLYGGTAEDARRLLRHALESIEALHIGHPRSPQGIVTLSIGATTMAPPEDLQTAMARADTALYKAKNDGRATISWA